MWMVLAVFLIALDIQEDFFLRMCQAGILSNLVIFAFNLFPLPPLDGGRIMVSLLPHKYSYRFAQLEPYGFVILLALLFFKLLHYWMMPIITAANSALLWAVSPLTFLLS